MGMETRPPNIRREYPLAGEQIGKAWGLMWGWLDTTFWYEGAELAKRVSEASPVGYRTVVILLQQARSAGILEVRYRLNEETGRKRAIYRVTPDGARKAPGRMSGELKAWLYGGSHYDDE